MMDSASKFDFSKTFEHWEWSIPMRNEASLVDFVYSGAKSYADLKPEMDAIAALGPSNEKLKVLEFGCGFGRNLQGMPEKWEVVAYDNPNMLKRVPEYFAARGPKLVKAELCSDWNELFEREFDAVLATFVFQHVPPMTLEAYLADLRFMTPKLVVFGRCWNDADDRHALWPLVEKYFKPVKPIAFKSLDDHVLVVFESSVFQQNAGMKTPEQKEATPVAVAEKPKAAGKGSGNE